MERLEKLLKDFPPDLHWEVEDFVQFLISKRSKTKGRKLRQQWAGALQDYRQQYTALELQRIAMERRGD
jgi:hypothetical protein